MPRTVSVQSSSMKQCSKCLELKDKSEFNKHVRGKDGLESYCRSCKSASRNREQAKELARAWRQDNPERAAVNRDRWLSEHPEVLKRAQENWRKNHKTEIEKYEREYRARRKKETREQSRERSKRYRDKNRDKIRHRNSQRKYRERGAPGSHLRTEWLEKCNLLGWSCSYCDTPLDTKTVTKDHVTPISRGGSNDIDNVVPCCSSCNSRKKDKTIEEFASRW